MRKYFPAALIITATIGGSILSSLFSNYEQPIREYHEFTVANVQRNDNELSFDIQEIKKGNPGSYMMIPYSTAPELKQARIVDGCTLEMIVDNFGIRFRVMQCPSEGKES